VIAGPLGEIRGRIRSLFQGTRIRAAGAAVVLVAVFAAIALVSGRTPGSISVVDISPSATSSVIVVPAAASPSRLPTPTPSPIPEGALPSPSERVTESADLRTPRPPATATPTPDPAVWRFEGQIVDAEGNPLKDVCVVIGPRGCLRASPHTDDRGVYYFDVPQITTVEYDLYFMKAGYAVVWAHVQPAAPTIFNVILRKN
jgi:hypothetical protein